MFQKQNTTFIVVLLLILILNTTVFADIGIEGEVSAYLLGDYETGELLDEYNIYRPMEVASITKLMSYLVIMDWIKAEHISLDNLVCIDEDVEKIEGSSLDLKAGESFTIEELLKAVVVISANDATYALAKHVAGSEKGFVKMMNEKAGQLGLNHSIYINSTGLPEGEVQNIMTPEDIFKLSRHIISKYPEILSIAIIPYIEVADRDYRKENTNPLLNKIKGIDGLKTGFTNKAGHCLVSTLIVKQDGEDQSFRLIGIVMGTENEEKREELGGQLIEYGIGNYHKKLFALKDKAIGMIAIPKSRDKDVEIYPLRSFSKIVSYNSSIDEDVLLDEKIRFPLRAGDKVGKLVISIDGYIVEEIDLIVNKDIKKEGFFRLLIRNIVGLLEQYFKKVVGKALSYMFALSKVGYNYIK